jgi:hypothetical protein
MWWDCPLNEIRQDPSIGFELYDDFSQYTTVHAGLTSTLVGGGAAVVLTGQHGGLLELDPTADDNDEAYVGSTYTIVVPTGAREIWFECSAKFTEASTSAANVMVGLSSTYATGALQAAGAGPPANYSGSVLYKVDGGTTWNYEVSNAASQTTCADIATRTSGSFTRLGFKLTGLSLGTAFINGVAVASAASNIPTSAMGLFFGVRNGAAANEKLYIDWYRLVGLR